MKKILSVSKARSRRVMLRGFLRWLLYAAVLLIFYLWLTNPLIKGFCPLLLIPLATAVAVYEGEFAAAVFGVFCGLMMDIASGTIAGFSSLWLLVCCPVISLLSQFWVKTNALSHFLLNASVCVVMGFLDFLFLHWVWEGADSGISFVRSVIPAYTGAVVAAFPVYLIVWLINKKLRPKEQRHLEESAQTAEESVDKVRE